MTIKKIFLQEEKVLEQDINVKLLKMYFLQDIGLAKMVRKLLKFIVKARMLYADLRGHHGKRWNYEPGDWYMGRKNKNK
jgi:hypothetical protein